MTTVGRSAIRARPSAGRLATIVRATRNYADLPFTWCASPDQRRTIQRRIRTALRSVRLRAREIGRSGLWVVGGPALTVDTRGDDHCHLQSALPGMAIRRGLVAIARAEAVLSTTTPFARHPAWGALTASLADSGHGLRVFFELRLPALTEAGYALDALQRLETAGLVPSPARPPSGQDPDATVVGQAWLLTHREPLGSRPLAWLAGPARAVAQVITLERAVAEQVTHGMPGVSAGGIAGIPKPR